ncbi:type II inositol 3,4-bisphosphate 4-phosphatase-like [Aplochiton taeniatus]
MTTRGSYLSGSTTCPDGTQGSRSPTGQGSLLCDCIHGSVDDKDNSPMMSAVLTSGVCKVYRFQTESLRWMLVREQMSETPLSFSLPKQLLALLIQDHTKRWEREGEWGDTASTQQCFKPSSSKTQRHLQFTPTNLHAQRMQVTCHNSPGVWYDVITVGAPAHHPQGFKLGGLHRLLHGTPTSDPRHAWSPAHTNNCAPVTNGNGTLPVPSSNQEAEASLQRQDLDRLDVEFDEEEWDRVWANVAKSLHCIIAMVDRLQETHHRPQEVTSQQQQPNSSHSSPTACGGCSWREHLLPLVVTLRQCVREAVLQARTAMTFVLLQGAAADRPLSAQLTHRRDAVFSQALCSVVSAVVLKLYASLDDQLFLEQLLKVGVLAQFECLLSTYGEEIGMLEDMEVGVSDLSRVTFTITKATTDQPTHLLPSLTGQPGCFVVEVPLPADTFGLLPGELRAGCLIRLHPVLFNIGINQQQSLAERFGNSSLQERINQQSCAVLKTYCCSLKERLPSFSQRGVEELLVTLKQNIASRRRKNVQVLELAASLCRRLNGVRLTSCKSAKDRTAMSVTLEQCRLLRDQHALSKEHFSSALDCMRRARLSWGQLQGCYSPAEWLCAGPEEGPSGPGRHLYPVAVLLVTSHLLVLWVILSLVLLLATNP